MKLLLPAILALLPHALSASEGRAAALAAQIRQAGLDAEECYRVRELNFSREDARFYLTEGYLIFGKPVAGRRFSAVFTAEVEGGDAEVMVLPPHRSERLSLASFTDSPNLNEHFRSALMMFTDDAAEELLAEIRSGVVRKSPEMGALLAGKWDSVLRNLVSSFEVRLVHDILAEQPERDGVFFAALGGTRLGNFDVVYDPRARAQITVGQVNTRDGRTYFDTWCHFQARSWRNGRREVEESDIALSDFRIETELDAELRMKGTTRVKATPAARQTGAIWFEVSSRVHVEGVTIDGEPAEVFERESLRANLIRDNGNNLFLVVPPMPLEAGRAYEIEFRHEGEVVTAAGNGVYYVASRSNWYPNRSMEFASYDLTFRYPRHLTLVATGERVEEREEGEQRVTRRKTETPVRFVGFNLGEYERSTAKAGEYLVEVYANRRLEPGLSRPPPPVIVMPGPERSFPRPPQRRPTDPIVAPMPTVTPPPPNPLARLEHLAGEVAAAMEFMSGHFGPPPLKTLTVSPIPGQFGQGFAGLLYLSTLSYLDPREISGQSRQSFFVDLLYAHETAHQWWGNSVTAEGYEHAWLMEALANYSALLFLEKRKGTRALDTVLDEYKTALLAKGPDGRTIESAGPIDWGLRLRTSQNPRAWNAITYGKGSWIVHMLRRLMGDEKFLAMLGELAGRYRFKLITTGEFRELAKEFMPSGVPDASLENFFDHWVHDTGIPTLKATHAVSGKAPALKLSVTVTQSDVSDDFSVWVPVEIHAGRGQPVVRWVRTGDEPVSFTVDLKQTPVRVLLDPGNSVLANKGR